MLVECFIKKIIILIIVVFFIVSIYPAAFAAPTPTFKNQFENSLQKTSGAAGYPSDLKLVDAKDELIITIGEYIQMALSFLGVLFLLLMIYGGYVWMKARGNETDVTRAKDIITNSGIGLVIVISAYAISYFVIYYFQTAGFSTT
jgi:hypothetical protein